MAEEGSSQPVITLDFLQRKLKALQAEARVAPAAAPTAPKKLPDGPLVEASAVLGLFNPYRVNPISGTIGPTDKEKNQAIAELLGFSEPVLVQPDQPIGTDFEGLSGTDILYRLREEVRIEVLRRLIQTNRVRMAVNANRALTIGSVNPLQQMLTRCLLGDLPNPADLGLEQLRGLECVCGWLSGIPGFHLPDRTEVNQRLDRTEMLQPFKHLTGIYQDGQYVETFRGRSSELQVLREYAGVAAPQGALEALKRGITAYLERVTSLIKRPPLMLTGLGGAGKSTLLAKFILSHAEAYEMDRFPFVYLDFDRPSISAMEPETLLVEAARQLAVQYVDLQPFGAAAQDFYTRWNTKVQAQGDTVYSETTTVHSSKTTKESVHNRGSILNEFIQLITGIEEFAKRPFLMVLDTFEEVQYRGRVFLSEFFQYFSDLQQGYPLMRLVLAGRAPVTEFPIRNLTIGDLDPAAARGYLERHGVTGDALVQQLISKLGGNPLTLKLAIEVIKAEELATNEKLELSTVGLLFDKKLPDIERQGVLYRRILDHIHDERVRKLANPGLTLREITPDVIQKVLSAPCQLEIKDAEDAKELFERLSAEVSLVTKTGAYTLRHRPDIRKVMFKMMTEARPELVSQIHQLAVDYYEKLPDLPAKAEGFYHRLCLDQPAVDLEKHWDDRLKQSLLSSVDELPSRAQSYLVSRTGIGQLSDKTRETAEESVRERIAIREATALLNTGKAKEALELCQITLGTLTQSRIALYALQVLALRKLHRTEEAADLAEFILTTRVHDPELSDFSKELYAAMLDRDLRSESGNPDYDADMEISL